MRWIHDVHSVNPWPVDANVRSWGDLTTYHLWRAARLFRYYCSLPLGCRMNEASQGVNLRDFLWVHTLHTMCMVEGAAFQLEWELAGLSFPAEKPGYRPFSCSLTLYLSVYLSPIHTDTYFQGLSQDRCSWGHVLYLSTRNIGVCALADREFVPTDIR